MPAGRPSFRTRLAPSPTGALHLGNARTFLVTWALARAQGWTIVLRVEDLDTPRVKPGVIDLTIDLLQWLGIDWDEGPFIQSADDARHRAAMRTLARAGTVYPSTHTRAQLGQLLEEASAQDDSPQSAPQEGSREARFPASLRPSMLPAEFQDTPGAWRFATPDREVPFDDLFLGPVVTRPAQSVGDFIVWTRRDGAKPGQASYQLAVVVDDHEQRVTHVVRGDDLVDSAGRQLLLMEALGIEQRPAYCHLPLVRGSDGKRLAKRHGDTRLDRYRAAGVSAERVIGLCAAWSGLIATPRPMSAPEFRDGLDLRTLPCGSVTFLPEHEQWLHRKD